MMLDVAAASKTLPFHTSTYVDLLQLFHGRKRFYVFETTFYYYYYFFYLKGRREGGGRGFVSHIPSVLNRENDNK